MSLNKLTNIATKALVGTEKLSPEALAATRKLVSETGRIESTALGKRKLLGDLLIGKKGATEAIKARYRQGGLIGPGGLVMGELALDPRYKDLIKGIRAARGSDKVLNPYTGDRIGKAQALRTAVGKGLTESINPMFLLAFPAMDVATAVNTAEHDPAGGTSGILRALGSGAGFAVGGPLGLLGGMAASSLGSGIGGSIGKLFDPSAPADYVPMEPGANKLTSNIALDAALPR